MQEKLKRDRQTQGVMTLVDPNVSSLVQLAIGFLMVAVLVSALAGTLRSEPS